MTREAKLEYCSKFQELQNHGKELLGGGLGILGKEGQNGLVGLVHPLKLLIKVLKVSLGRLQEGLEDPLEVVVGSEGLLVLFQLTLDLLDSLPQLVDLAL